MCEGTIPSIGSSLRSTMVRPVFGGKPDGGGCRRARPNGAVLWAPEEMVVDPANGKTPGSVRTALPPSPGGGVGLDDLVLPGRTEPQPQAQSATLRASPPNTCSTERGSRRPGAAPGESDALCAGASSAARARGGPAHAPAIRLLSGREAWADGCRLCSTLGAAREHVHRMPSPAPWGTSAQV